MVTPGCPDWGVRWLLLQWLGFFLFHFIPTLKLYLLLT